MRMWLCGGALLGLLLTTQMDGISWSWREGDSIGEVTLIAPPQEPRSPAPVTIASGLLKVADSVQVPAEINGVLAELACRESQLVRRGDLLARVKRDELEVRLKRAELERQISLLTAENDVDVRFAEKALEVSQAQVSRSLESNRLVPGVVPEARINEQQLEVHRDSLSLEQARRDQRVAALQVNLKSEDVALSRILLDRSDIRSPLDGMVVAVETRAGEWVEPGVTVAKIVRLDRLRVEAFVPAQAASTLSVGDPAVVTPKQAWLAEQEFRGRLVFINPEVNPVNAHVQVWIEVDNPELKLLPGLEVALTLQPGGTQQ